MAKAIQCDRCKKFAPVLSDSKPLPIIDLAQPQWTPIGTNVICDACSLDFIDFMADVIAVDPGDGTIKQDQLNRQTAAKIAARTS